METNMEEITNEFVKLPPEPSATKETQCDNMREDNSTKTPCLRSWSGTQTVCIMMSARYFDEHGLDSSKGHHRIGPSCIPVRKLHHRHGYDTVVADKKFRANRCMTPITITQDDAIEFNFYMLFDKNIYMIGSCTLKNEGAKTLCSSDSTKVELDFIPHVSDDVKVKFVFNVSKSQRRSCVLESLKFEMATSQWNSLMTDTRNLYLTATHKDKSLLIFDDED
jgi:hypothetical protein